MPRFETKYLPIIQDKINKKNQEKKEVENPREVPEEIKVPSILLLSEQFHDIGKLLPIV